jgi:anhydro-N-acetylmuramic acid kinase
LGGDLYIGLMSGTSVDGIDAALVDFGTDGIRLIDFHYQPFPTELREQILAIRDPGKPQNLIELGRLDAALGQLFAETALTLLDKTPHSAEDIRAIGSHGQTVCHAPQGDNAFSMQIGDPNRIAQLTGITTIADFRRRDIAVGGQGAPLVPAFHQALFGADSQVRTIVNIGGIANITVLDGSNTLGFDTGPGNTLIDFWYRHHHGKNFDRNGAWGQQGHVVSSLLEHLLNDVYFAQSPPKSTGTEYFSPDWLLTKLAQFDEHRPQDVQATLHQLTAMTIANDINRYAGNSVEVIICGGGAHNGFLLQLLANQLPCPVTTSARYGIHPDHVEAMAFAWLARQTLQRKPGNLCQVTGASNPVILGAIYPGNL